MIAPFWIDIVLNIDFTKLEKGCVAIVSDLISENWIALS